MQQIILEIQERLAEAVKSGNQRAEHDLLELKWLSEQVIQIEKRLTAYE